MGSWEVGVPTYSKIKFLGSIEAFLTQFFFYHPFEHSEWGRLFPFPDHINPKVKSFLLYFLPL
jgi:hypothetical protein